MKFKEYINDILNFKILNEVKLDFNDSSYFNYIKKYNGYIWNIFDTEMIFRGYHISNNNWLIKFGVHKGNGSVNIDLTNSFDMKKTIKTLEDVSKSLLLFIKQYNPNQITFTADKRSRQKIYERIIFLLHLKQEFQNYSLPTKEKSLTDNSITYIIKRK